METRRSSRWMVPVAVVGILLLSCSTASAVSASDTMREFFRQALIVLDDPKTATNPQEALRKIRGMADTLFDVREAAPASLGSHWAALSPAEREEFIRLFGRLVEQAYLTWVASLIGGQRVDIRFGDETRRGAATLVRTTIQARDGRSVPFDYSMSMRQGRWTVRDVIVDNVSLLDNYRAQFKYVLASAPYSSLIASMRAKTADGARASASMTQPETSALGREVRSQAP